MEAEGVAPDCLKTAVAFRDPEAAVSVTLRCSELALAIQLKVMSLRVPLPEMTVRVSSPLK